MAVQPTRHAMIQQIERESELSQLIRYDRDAVLCFYDQGSNEWQRFLPNVEKQAQKFNGTTFAEIDIRKMKDIVQQYKIQRTPTFIAMSEGKEVNRIEGADEQKLNALMQQVGRIRDVRQRRWAGKHMSKIQERRLPKQQWRQKKEVSKQQQQQQEQQQAKRPAAMKQAPKEKKMMMKQEAAKDQQLWHIVLEKPKDDQEFDKLLQNSGKDVILIYFGGDLSKGGVNAALLEDYLGMKYPGAVLLKIDRKIANRYNIADETAAFLRVRDGKTFDQFEIVNDKLLNEAKEMRQKAESRGEKMLRRRSMRKQRIWKNRKAELIGRDAVQPCQRYEFRGQQQQKRMTMQQK